MFNKYFLALLLLIGIGIFVRVGYAAVVDDWFEALDNASFDNNRGQYMKNDVRFISDTGWGRVNAPAAVALAAAPRFVIRDNAGNHLGAIDNAGNLSLEGRFNTLGSACNPLTVTNFASEFVIMSEDTVVAKLDASGDFWTFGTLYTEVPTTVDLGNLTGSHILVQDSEGDEVAVIVSESFTNSILEPNSPHEVKAGSLLLRGRYLSGSDPDGDGLFLETCS